MIARLFYLGSLLALSYAAAPGKQHLPTNLASIW